MFAASFAHSNLSGVNLAGVILHTTNFWKTNLSGVDFTVTDVITDGLTFMEANLSNSNFEGVDLSPKTGFFNIFKNKAHLNNLANFGWTNNALERELFSDAKAQFIISTEVRGNDLAVKFVFFNNFAYANLEDANFKNAKLLNTNFYSANLTNADLSGADLRKALLVNADLSNANLESTNLLDADLSGANLDEDTILKCIHHPVCEGG